MNYKGRSRAHVCLTATTTAIFAGTACGQAFGSHTHILKPGETVEFLGRHYHLPVKDILTANHINANDILLNGRSLYIPDAPRQVIVPHTMRKEARIKGDRISVRMGPSSFQHRMRLCDNGTKLVITAARNDWLQVMLPDGRSGWVRNNYIDHAGAGPLTNLARNLPELKDSLASAHGHHALTKGKERQGHGGAVAAAGR